MSGPVIVYADPLRGGHHPEYLRFFAAELAAQGFVVEAHVPRSVLEQAGLAEADPTVIRHVDAPDLQTAGFPERLRFARGVFRAAKGGGARAVLFSYLDHMVAPLAWMAAAGRRAPTPWTGILFRDGFNYPADEGGAQRLKSRAKAALLRSAVRTGAFGVLTLNPFWRLKLACPVTWLPDCLSELDQIAAREAAEAGVWPLPKASAAAGEGRVGFLLFGAMAPRKGALEFLQALAEVDAPLLRRVEVRLLGRFPDAAYRARVETAVAAVIAGGGRVEIEDAYVSNARLDAAVRDCDVMVAAYLDHVGSSGVLGIAIQYGRPVLGQATQQIGEEVRAFDLGPVARPADRLDYTRLLEGVISAPPRPSPGMARARATRNIDAARAVVHALFARFGDRR